MKFFWPDSQLSGHVSLKPESSKECKCSYVLYQRIVTGCVPFCNPTKTFVNHHKSDSRRYLSSTWTTLEGFSARNPISHEIGIDLVKHNFCARISGCFTAIFFIEIDSKVARSVWGCKSVLDGSYWYCGTISERFTKVDTGFTKLLTASDSAINEHLHSFELLATVGL